MRMSTRLPRPFDPAGYLAIVVNHFMSEMLCLIALSRAGEVKLGGTGVVNG